MARKLVLCYCEGFIVWACVTLKQELNSYYPYNWSALHLKCSSLCLNACYPKNFLFLTERNHFQNVNCYYFTMTMCTVHLNSKFFIKKENSFQNICQMIFIFNNELKDETFVLNPRHVWPENRTQLSKIYSKKKIF